MSQKAVAKKHAHPLHEDIAGGVMQAIHTLYFTIQKRLESLLLKHQDVSFSQFMILIGFSCEEYPHLTQAKLAENLSLTEATVSRHITTLVNKNFLIKERVPSNKKSYQLTLTPLGIKAYTKAKKLVTKELDSYFSVLEEKDKKMIVRHFTTVTTSLQQKK